MKCQTLFLGKKINGLCHGKTCLQAYADSDSSDQQSDKGLSCLLTELFDTKECMNGEQRPG